MNRLSCRLAAVASFIDNNDKVMIDIGCDHALLSIFLAKRYPNLVFYIYNDAISVYCIFF